MDFSLVEDLLEHPKVVETRDHIHHGIAKYDHIMRVTRFSYHIARIIKADVRVCVRAGLLHDIDSRLGTLANHGDVAARWAQEYGEEEAVCAAIMSHMYPFSPPPTSREGWILTIADKAASMADLTDYVRGLINGRSQERRRSLQESDPHYRPKAKPKPRERLRAAFEMIDEPLA